MEKKHTFAILAYKESKHLQECIDSLKKQQINSEIIICTSTPSAFLDSVAKRNNLPVFINKEHAGIASDWNFALRQAHTKFITLAHQDDLYKPQYAKKIIHAMESRTDTLIAYSNYEELLESGGNIYARKKSLNFFTKKTLNLLAFGNKPILAKNKTRLLLFGNPIGCPAVTYHRENIASFEFDKNFSVNLDWDAWYRLAQKKGSFHWINEPLMIHRIHDESETTRGIKENRRQTEDLTIFKRIWPTPIAFLLGALYSLSYKNNK